MEPPADDPVHDRRTASLVVGYLVIVAVSVWFAATAVRHPEAAPGMSRYGDSGPLPASLADEMK